MHTALANIGEVMRNRVLLTEDIDYAIKTILTERMTEIGMTTILDNVDTLESIREFVYTKCYTVEYILLGLKVDVAVEPIPNSDNITVVITYKTKVFNEYHGIE